MLLPRLALAALLALASPISAEIASETATEAVSVDQLGKVMQLDALFQVLRDEGLAHADTIEADMFPSGGGGDWTAAVSRIYDVGTIRSRFTKALEEALASDTTALADIIAFYNTDLGQRILGLEVEARRAFLDTAAEEAAQVAADDAAATRDPKVPLIRRMIESSDLLEMNVAGALSGNLAFMTGMNSTGVYGEMPPDQILSDVWAQEDQIRTDTSTWLYSYLGLAYHPLTEAELKTYIEFWESPAGQRLNAALFSAFDVVFHDISTELGRAAGRAMQGRDI